MMDTTDPYFFKKRKLQTKIIKTVNENNKEVIPLKYKKGKKKVWIKRPRESKSKPIHKAIYFLSKIKGLMPVEEKTKKQAIEHEVQKLQRLKKSNINVPKVIAYQNDFFVLEDTGITIKSFLKDPSIDSKTVHKTIKKCIKLLAKMHNLSEYHAGPQIKNYTIKNNKIYAIDFEDSFSSKYDIKELQYRDLFLFLVSLTELKRDIDYKKIIKIYQKKTNNDNINKELKAMALKLNFLIKIIEFKPLQKYLAEDVKSNYRLFKSLQNI